jgi:hypothetical protein
MAINDGIQDIYRVSAVGPVGGGFAFSRLRVRKKQQKHKPPDGDQHQDEQIEQEPTEKDSSPHVDIRA